MSVEALKPFVVGFDGLHRAGKGTQGGMLHTAITNNGGRSVIVRGDGTRDGLGLTPGDPYSAEWQARGRSVKSPEGNTVEAWNASAYALVKELNEILNSQDDTYDALIVDRTILSRVAFLLHRGVGVKGTRMTLDQMYPDNKAMPESDRIDISQAMPDIIFDLKVNSPHDMLARLDHEDPKYQFRSRNIKGGYDAATVAAQHLPVDLERRVQPTDALRRPEQVHERVCQHLGSTAIGRFLH